MPNRIIKDTIRTSKSVNALTDFQFRVWLYLITYVDDYGCGSADAELLKGFVFPRRKGITESQIQKAIDDLASMSIIHLYQVDGESYLCFPNWDKHQRIQAKKRKFPEPPKDLQEAWKSESDGESQYVTVSHGESPPKSNPNTNPNTNPNPISATPLAESDSVTVIALPLNDGTEKAVTQEEIDKWRELYPAVDIMAELRKMYGWLDGNPKNKKTRSGIGRFINSWLSRAQDGAKKVTTENKDGATFKTEEFFDKAVEKANAQLRAFMASNTREKT